MKMSKLSKNITYEDELQAGIALGIEKVYRVAKAAYGPLAGNAFLEENYGDPTISRDGVTNVEKVYLEDAVENMAARTLIQASRKSDKKVGDGTTAVTILSYHLYKEARKLISSGENRMAVSKKLQEVATEVLGKIDAYVKDVDDSLLKSVAVVSAGDENIGEMISDIISEVGSDAGITVEDFAGVGIYNEIVDGFYWRRGFTNINLINDASNLESNLSNVSIFLSDRSFKAAAEIYPVIEKMVGGLGKGKEVLFVGDFADEVLAALVLNKINGVLIPTIVDVNTFGPMRTMFLDDLATVTGSVVLAQGTNPKDFHIDMLGGADKVIVNEFSTTIMGGDGPVEDLNTRVTELKAQLADADSPVTQNALRDRISRLTGKIAIIRVGGATETEQGETKLRVRDAVCAVQAAVKGGVVPGGGVTLARIGATLSSFSDSYKEPFKQLVDNAGENAEAYIAKVLDSPDLWSGFNLRDNKGIVNLLDAGVLDPADVIREVVTNSASVVAKLITTTVAVTYVNREEKHD